MAYRQNDSQRRNEPFHFDLMEHIGVLSIKDNGWAREVNIVAWNGGSAKVDIREWDPEHARMSKGVTLFDEEAEELAKMLARRYGLRLTDRGPARREFVKAENDRFFTGNDGPLDYEGEFEETPEAGASAAAAAEEAAGAESYSEAPAAAAGAAPAGAQPFTPVSEVVSSCVAETAARMAETTAHMDESASGMAESQPA